MAYLNLARLPVELQIGIWSFIGVGAGVDPQLSTEGRGGSDGTGAPEAGAVCFAFGGWLSSPMLLYLVWNIVFPCSALQLCFGTRETRLGEPWGTEWRTGEWEYKRRLNGNEM